MACVDACLWVCEWVCLCVAYVHVWVWTCLHPQYPPAVHLPMAVLCSFSVQLTREVSV